MTEGNGQNGSGDSSAEAPVVIEHQKKRAMLEAFRMSGNVRAACEHATIGRTTHYDWLRTDPDYVTAFEIAKQDAADMLEAAAVSRAVTGTREFIYHNGKPVVDSNGAAVFKVHYSDVLLIFLLKGLRPEKYRERYDVSGEVQHQMQDHRKMLDQASADPEFKDLMRQAQKRMRELQPKALLDHGSNGSNGNGSNNGGG